MVSPPIVYRAVLGGDGRTLDSALLWAFGMSLLWVATLHAFFRRPAYLHLLLAPLYVTVAADLFLIFEFRARLTTSYLSIIVSDYTEAGEFVRSYSRSVAVGILLLVAVWSVATWGVRGTRTHWPRWAKWAGVALLVAGYVVAGARQMLVNGTPLSRAALDIASHDYSSPVGTISQLGVTLALRQSMARLLETRRMFSFEATKPPGDAEEIYILVVGESSRPDRWSLNGYQRETNPLLARESRLVSFTDVITTAPTTATAVPSLLSLAPVTDWESVQAQKSIIGAFREAGFQTYWLSSQEVSHWGGIIPACADEAHVRRYYDRSLDRVLVDDLKGVLTTPGRAKRLFVVLHTRGSHFEFSARYPSEFRAFPENVPTRREYISNTYDNSILYTDRILSDIIGLVRPLHARAAVMYVSDHGENLLDDNRQLFGHAIGNEYDLPSAAFVWWSEELAAAVPEKIEAVLVARDAPLSISNFPHSLLDVAGIQARGLDRGKSVFARSLRQDDRTYIAKGRVMTWRGAAPASATAGALQPPAPPP